MDGTAVEPKMCAESEKAAPSSYSLSPGVGGECEEEEEEEGGGGLNFEFDPADPPPIHIG